MNPSVLRLAYKVQHPASVSLPLCSPQSKLPAASPLSPLSFPHCLQAPTQRLEQYCEALEELGGINPASDSALSILRHAQRHGEDLRASDLIAGCPVRAPAPLYSCICNSSSTFCS